MHDRGQSIGEWASTEVADLAALVGRACPDEGLSSDELLACCWDDPGIVLGRDDRAGAVAAVVRSFGELRIGYLKLLAVDPTRRRGGIGRTLLEAAESWAFDLGASEMLLAGSAPFYLWPGVDTRALGMLCLAEAAGYESTGVELNFSLPTTFRADVPSGIGVRRVLEEDDVAAVHSLLARCWPEWREETDRAVEHGTCHAAVDEESGALMGFACHSVNRAGWVGPMGTDPDRGRAGVGHALLGRLCRDLMIADMESAEIAWVGPVRFYAKAGATVSRVFRTYRRHKP